MRKTEISNLNLIDEPQFNTSFGIDFKYLFTKDRNFIIFTFILAFIIHIILWKAYPLHWGPDGHTYMYYFVDIFNKEPILPMILTYRTPIAPFFYGFFLKIGGSIAASIASEIISLALIPGIYLLALSWDKTAARISTIAFVLFLPYHIQFHQISSDALFSWFLIILFVAFKYAIIHKNILSWTLLGIISSLTILTRPSGLVIILMLFALLFLKINFKHILKLAGVYMACIIVLLGSYITFKGIKLNDYSLSRGSGYTAFMRIYTLQEPIWDPKNGPASQKLVKLVEENLLTTDLYKKYNITLEKVLKNKHNRRILGDIIVMVDRTEGWDTEYELLKEVAFESIKANPSSYFKNYLKDILLLSTIDQPIPNPPHVTDTKLYLRDINLYDEGNLPEPNEGELIPFSNTWWMLSSPDGSLPTQTEVDNFNSRYESLVAEIDNAKGDSFLVNIIDKFWSLIKIPITYFWIFGIIAIIFSPRKNKIISIYVYILSVIIIIGTLYGAHVYSRYRLPLDPLLITVGIGGIFTLIDKIYKKETSFKENRISN